MLQNILLKAGEWNSIAKQGKFINVVLAAGDISARITKLNNQTFETKLVSGMAFPVPDGFQSVAFFSEANQQTKIWLGDLPLTYSPINSKLVGSEALSSTQVKSFYNLPLPTVPAKSQRGKVTLQAEKDFFLGGAGIAVGNAIKVSAFERFEVNTQGAIYTYSPDSDDLIKTVSELRPLKVPTVNDIGSTADKPLYNHVTDEVIVFTSASILSRVPRGQVSPVVTIATGLSALVGDDQQEHFIEGDNLVIFGFSGADFCKSVISLADYSYVVTVLLVAPAFSVVQCVQVLKGSTFLVCEASAGGKVFIGAMDGSLSQELSNVPVASAKRGWLLPNGDVALIDTSYTSIHVTNDIGVTWEQRALPDGCSPQSRLWCRDDVTATIFYAADSGKGFFYSVDNAVTWSARFFANNVTVYSLYCVDNLVYGGQSGQVSIFDLNTEVSESISAGAGASSVKWFAPSAGGRAFAASGSGRIADFIGEPITAGGMNINVLEEIS